MPSTFGIPEAAQITKSFYSSKEVGQFGYTEPFVGLLPKVKGTGENYVMTVGNQLMTSVSANAQVAFGGTGNQDSYTKFTFNYVLGYGQAQVAGPVFRQTASDSGSFVRVITKAVSNGIRALGLHLGSAIHSSGSGLVAQVTNINGLVCTVANTGGGLAGIRALGKGATLQGALVNTPNSSALPGTVTITAIDYNAGTFTTNVAIASGIPGFVVNSYVGLNGDLGGKKVVGTAGWIPDANNRPTSSENFGGTPLGTRANDPTALAGNYISGGGATKAETLIQAAALIDQCDGKADTLILNHLDAADIQKVFQAQNRLTQVSSSAPDNPKIGYKGFGVQTGMGEIKCYTSSQMAQGSALMTSMDSWEMPTVGPFISVIDQPDGLTWHAVPGDDVYACRLGYMLALGNARPWESVAILW